MSTKKATLREKLEEGQKYVEELIYENMGLLDKNIRLYFENKNLREKVEKLEKVKKENEKKSLKKEEKGYVVVIFNMGHGYVN